MKQAPSTKTDGINTQLNLDMSPAELLKHLEAKHGPLTEKELKEIREFLVEMIEEVCDNLEIYEYCGDSMNDPNYDPDKPALDQIGLESLLIKYMQTKFHEKKRDKELRGTKCMVNHSPEELLITNFIIEFVMSHKFNFQLRRLRESETGGGPEVGPVKRLFNMLGGNHEWQGRVVHDDIERVIEILEWRMDRKDWLESIKKRIVEGYPPVSHPDFDFLMNYLRKMAQKDSDTPSKSSKTRKKVGDILGKKK